MSITSSIAKKLRTVTALLTLGTVADGEYLKRDGLTVVGGPGGSAGTTINTTDGAIPYRLNSGAFADSPLDVPNATTIRLNGAAGAGLSTSGNNLTFSAGFYVGAGNYFGANGRSLIQSPADGKWIFVNNNADAVAGMLFGRVVAAKTGDYGVLFSDSNTFFTNTGASGAVIFTLPTPVVGMTFEFYRDANQTVTLEVGGAVTIRAGTSVSTGGGSVTLDAVGSRIRLVAISTTQWVGDLTGAATFA